MPKKNWAFMTIVAFAIAPLLRFPCRSGTRLKDQAMGERRSFSAHARTAAFSLAAAAFAGSDRPAEAAGLAVTCTNPFSGASWQIAIDYDLNTVDSNPASIDQAEISWRDAKDGWRYTLDRKSGALTVILASATGGNFLHDQCQLPN
jgi:hypothetical protein